MKKLTVEVQHFEGCPNSPILIERIKKALNGFDNIEYKEIIIDSIEKAKEVNFRGSPTLLINRIDFEGLPEQELSSLSCRIYKNGLPAIDDIRTRIESMLRSS